MIYNKAPFDPEAVASTDNFYQGIDHFMMPSLRNVGFSLNFKFLIKVTMKKVLNTFIFCFINGGCVILYRQV